MDNLIPQRNMLDKSHEPERSPNEAMIHTALEYLKFGYRPIPLVTGTKRAEIKWKEYQGRPPDEEKVRSWFSSSKPNIALLTGNGVVNPGDTLTLTIDPSTHQAKRIEIASSADGHSFAVEGTFKTLKSGLTFMQFAQVEVPDKNISLQVHNYDYVPND